LLFIRTFAAVMIKDCMMDKNCNRNYGFKHISEEYKWMTHNWTKELAKHEPDLEVRDYVTEILEDLTTPEKSRLVSSTDDEVYKWLMTSIDFFAKNDAFELCYNIQKAIEIIRKFIADSEKNHAEPVAIDSYGLPF